MSYLILVKHSLPEIDSSRPAREWVLNEEGRRRCDELAEALRKYAPQAIVSSDEPKARETAERVALNLGLVSIPFPNLHEHARQTVPFLGKAAFDATVQRFFAKPDALVFGEETADDAHARFANAVQQAMAQHSDKTLVIVAHGTVISLLVSRACNVDGFTLWKQLGLPAFIVLVLPAMTIESVVNEIK